MENRLGSHQCLLAPSAIFQGDSGSASQGITRLDGSTENLAGD